ncbi:MAG TPA: hypothetical protein VGX25_07610 [Actinophytocola sp.]|uniref:PD-(D/E)XK nuclease domain-containing protein n=1 Tax=Actinophytocola sp. TaxID=1872138 RepID=UPI002DDCA180|nr:hypothetical protein [Actinophytocola sp.]HEV2779253.1 hypothetical protein [Actinophytocola sp.]
MAQRYQRRSPLLATLLTKVGLALWRPSGRPDDQTLLSRTHLSLLLKRFPAAMRRWRWDDDDRVKEPIRWPITSEREIQDILYLILRSVFDDVNDEDPNPKVGHASTRSDFGIPSLRLLVEIKYIYAGPAAEFKKIEQEVMTDSVAYLQRATHYDEIVVFIDDSTASVEHHDLTRDALTKVPGIADVIVVSRPGVLAQGSSTPTAKKGERARREGCPGEEGGGSQEGRATGTVCSQDHRRPVY